MGTHAHTGHHGPARGHSGCHSHTKERKSSKIKEQAMGNQRKKKKARIKGKPKLSFIKRYIYIRNRAMTRVRGGG
jgi:hypothetical protein